METFLCSYMHKIFYWNYPIRGEWAWLCFVAALSMLQWSIAWQCQARAWLHVRGWGERRLDVLASKCQSWAAPLLQYIVAWLPPLVPACSLLQRPVSRLLRKAVLFKVQYIVSTSWLEVLRTWVTCVAYFADYYYHKFQYCHFMIGPVHNTNL